MIDRALQINLRTFGGEETPWIHLFQETPPTDEIDQQEAAEIIDTAFNTVPCFEGEQETVDKEDPTVWDKIAAIMKKVAGATFCEKNADGGWDLIIRVAVSDTTKFYTLLVDGGEIGITQVVNEIVSGTKIIEGSSQFTFDYPVLGEVEFTCPVPFVIDGSTVYFQESVTTHFIYSYRTQYDRVTLTTKPEYGEDNIPTTDQGKLDLRKYDNGQIGQLIEKPCTVTGLYTGRSRQITLELPEIDESIEEPETICLTVGGIAATGGSRVCYEEITHITNCECSDRTYPGDTLRIEKIVVPCPEEIKDCPAIHPGCTSVLSRIERRHYVSCPDVFDTFDGDTPEFYEEKCCEPPKIPLPKCATRTTAYVGNKPIKEGEQHWIDHYSYADVSFHPVTPQSGVCGKTIVEQVLRPKNCCEGVSAIMIDYDATPDVLPAGESIIVYWSGGISPFTVSLSAYASHFAFGGREIITSNSYVTIFADESFCGNTAFTITDGCTTSAMIIRSSEGEWVLIESTECLLPDIAVTTILPDGKSGEAIFGKYKQVETLAFDYLLGDGWKCSDVFPDNSLAPACVKSALCPSVYKGLMNDKVQTQHPEYGTDTCLDFDPETLNYTYNIVESYGEGYNGGLVYVTDIYTAFVCNYDEGSWSGSVAQIVYATIKTDSLVTYEWRC